MAQRKDELIELLKENPDDSFLNYALALETEKEGDIKSAIRMLQKLTADDVEYLAAYYQLARMLIAGERNNEAVPVIATGMQLAQLKNERHTLAELRMLLDEISGE